MKQESSSNTPPHKRWSPKRKTIVIGSVVFGLALLAQLITGIFTYSFAVIGCGRQPVAANRFGADYHYYEPGSAFYRVSPFYDYYCTTQEAKAKGFNPGD